MKNRMKTTIDSKDFQHIVTFRDVVVNVNATEREPEKSGLERVVGLEHIEPENLHIKSWGDVADRKAV